MTDRTTQMLCTHLHHGSRCARLANHGGHHHHMTADMDASATCCNPDCDGVGAASCPHCQLVDHICPNAVPVARALRVAALRRQVAARKIEIAKLETDIGRAQHR